MIRRCLRALVLTLLTGMAGSAVAAEFASLAVISSTLGVNGSRLCIGEASRGDVGCPTYAPSLTSAGHVSVTGNLSAAKFIGDGSGLTGLNAGAGDRISTSGVASGANLGMVVANQGTVSFTTGGVAGTAYLTTTGLLVGPGVSATGAQSDFTSLYVSGNLRVGNTNSPAKFSSYFSPAISADSSTNYLAAWNQVTANESFSYTGNLYGSLGRVSINISQTGNVNAAVGAQGDVYNYTTATVAAAYGVVATVGNSGSGTISTAQGVRVSIANSGGGTVTTGYGVYIGGVSAVTGYGLYQAGTSNINYFAGKVGIGTAAPSATFHIAGTARTTSWTMINANATPTVPLEVSGTVKATAFVGDGSGLTNLTGGASADRIVSTSANVVVGNGGTISFTTGGVSGTAYLTTTGLFVGPGISATANTSSFTTIYASGNVGIGTTAPSTTLTVSGTVWGKMFVYETRSGLAAPVSQTATGGGSGTPGGSSSHVQFNNGGAFAGSSGLTWNDGTGTLTATNVSVTGNISAAKFIGDGSALTGVGGTADALVSNTTRVTANGASGYISLTTAGTTTGYFTPGGVLVANGISTTTNQASVTTLKANSIATASLASDAPAGFCVDDANIGKMIMDPATGRYGLCRAN